MLVCLFCQQAGLHQGCNYRPLFVLVTTIGAQRRMNNDLTILPYGLPGTIYRSPLPGSPLFDPAGRLFAAYSAAGVDVVVMLTPEDEAQALTGLDLRSEYQSLGFEVVYAPVTDFSVPESGTFQEPIQTALQAAQAGQTIVIHCHAGRGRTGIFAACLAKVVFKLPGDEAVSWVRHFIPNAVENQRQFQFVIDFQEN